MQYVVHCHHAPYNIYIGRGSIFGNPYSHIPDSKALYIVKTREEAIKRYAEYLLTNDYLVSMIPTLKHKILGCYCYPLSCHGHILAALANEDYEFDTSFFQ
jgi:hypothetical protein